MDLESLEGQIRKLSRELAVLRDEDRDRCSRSRIDSKSRGGLPISVAVTLSHGRFQRPTLNPSSSVNFNIVEHSSAAINFICIAFYWWHSKCE